MKRIWFRGLTEVLVVATLFEETKATDLGKKKAGIACTRAFGC